MRKLSLRLLPYAALLLATQAIPTFGANANWYPVKMIDASSETPKPIEYTPLEKAGKPYNVCVLFPHMKDSFFVAVAYGVVEQSKALGINMHLHEAGGYGNLPKQLSQFDDCLASGADAIVIAAISQVGLAKEVQAAKAKGIPVVAVANTFESPDLAAGVFINLRSMAQAAAGALTGSIKPGETANVVAFPGPPGSGWAERINGYFKDIIANDGRVKLLATKYGDTGVAVQLGLVQDALQTYPSMNYIWGTAPTAEAAVGALAESGRTDIKIVSTYENQALLDALKRGDIVAFTTQYPVLEGRVAIDEAVRALDKKPLYRVVQPQADVIDKNSLSKVNLSNILAPVNWSPVYNVKP